MNHIVSYLASPYTNFHAGLDAAFVEAARLAGALTATGVHVFSPIVHGHVLSRHGDLNPLDLSIWYPFNTEIMARCDVLIVAQMPGWERSKGVSYEIDFFRERLRPIFDLDPKTLTLAKRFYSVSG